MVRYFPCLIAIGCTLMVATLIIGAAYLLVNIEHFAALAQSNLGLPIQWQTVTDGQLYGLWMLTALYLSLGITSLYFLRRAFANFARGQLFTLDNSRDLRLFSIFLFAQALAKPIHFALASLLLSMNHPAGERMLSISLGSGEVSLIGLAIIFWVLSDLLVKASQLENENRQFI